MIEVTPATKKQKRQQVSVTKRWKWIAFSKTTKIVVNKKTKQNQNLCNQKNQMHWPKKMSEVNHCSRCFYFASAAGNIPKWNVVVGKNPFVMQSRKSCQKWYQNEIFSSKKRKNKKVFGIKNPSNKGKEANFSKKNILLWFKKRFKSSKSKYRNLEEIKKKKEKKKNNPSKIQIAFWNKDSKKKRTVRHSKKFL